MSGNTAPRRVIIIGGGVGGLAASIRLAAKGLRVTLLEKNATLGGKLNTWSAPHPNRPADRPFLFDTGPSLLTLPFVFADLFESAGQDVRTWLPILRLDPVARFQWHDGNRLELRADPNDMEAQIRSFAPGDLDGWRKLAQRGRRIWDLSADMFLFHAPEQALRGKHKGENRINPLAGLAMLTIPFRIGMFQNYAAVINRHIKSPRLREVLYQYATYSGASPFKAPATLAVIPHAERHFGGWYPEGGMYRIATSLEQLARQLGVIVRTNSPVNKILLEKSAKKSRKSTTTRGVRLADGTELPADAVIVNADVVHAYRHLIDPEDRPHYPDQTLDRLEPGGSGMILMLGVEGTYPQLAHHTKFMPDDYTSDLTAMFQTRTIPKDPCIYVSASTRTDPSQAPDGCENLFVLCSAPSLDGKLDWNVAGPQYERQILDTLENRWGLTDLSRRIVVKRRMTPADLSSTYNANAGSIYGIGSNSRRAAFLRPPNRDRKIAGLYFAGGATHPGGGLPLVASSGKIAAELLCEDFGID